MSTQSSERGSIDQNSSVSIPITENPELRDVEASKQSLNSLEKLKLWLDIGKFVIGTVLLGIFSTVINAQIQYKQIALNQQQIEQQHLSKFIEQAMSDRLIHRIRFAKYFATLTLSEDARGRWQQYYQELDAERQAKEKRIAEIYAVLPDEIQRAENTGDLETFKTLQEEKKILENDVGAISKATPTEEGVWKKKLDHRIVDEATFTWRQAIVANGNLRIPTSSGVVKNIEQMAVKLQAIQDQLSKPIEIVRWYVTDNLNPRFGASSNSHYTGGGVDIRVTGYTGKELAQQLQDWPGGMGLYPDKPDVVHLDNRPQRIRWGGLQ
ncbi:hypothetical protein Nos7524_4207 [Nostoc sp. PCC 7524]|uniref:D-Ala-D-Ala carboxypeptidase family metallohydrolase n=1 Tax=Nostoc sp. (strain ATCC 29411 / PCC 7524) TaxID=28072 RepID=UPI00029F3787|nr:D-Ala-D-Ala carboxypeptidase family metallohydrolase [Nostoc sp. PCC 7524]AFY49968.1 hypothetical protein Nos7524_4207 [Nostoc sp. PCC 7524]